jgi:hypothetical protein
MVSNGYLIRVLCMNMETRRQRVRAGNRWQDEVREDGRIVGGKVGRKKSCKELSHSAHASGIG